MEHFDDIERLYAGFVYSDSSHIDILQESIKFIISVLTKIVDNPYEPKYKRFQADNPKVRKLLVDIHGSYHFIRRVCKFKLEKEDKKDGSEPKQYFILSDNDSGSLVSPLSALSNLQIEMTYMQFTEIIKIVQMDSSSFFAGFFKTDTVDDVREFVARTRTDRNLVKGKILEREDPHIQLSPERRKELVSEEKILQYTTFSQLSTQQSQFLNGEITVEEAKLGGSMLRLSWPGDFGRTMMEKTAVETSKKVEEEKKKKMDEINTRLKNKEALKAKRVKEREDALIKFKEDRELKKEQAEKKRLASTSSSSSANQAQLSEHNV